MSRNAAAVASAISSNARTERYNRRQKNAAPQKRKVADPESNSASKKRRPTDSRKKKNRAGDAKRVDERKGNRYDDVNLDMETRWPLAILRYSYTILSRNSFDSVKFLAQGGLGVVFTAKLKAKFHLPGITGETDEKKRRTTTQVVLKCVLNPNDWNSEISGYHHNRDNPHVVGVAALVLLSSRECNQLCKDRKNYVTRPEGTLVPAMVFEKWDGSLDDAIEDGLVQNWGLMAAVDVMIGVAKAMAELHKNSSMHRDINPANILYKTAPTTGNLVGALSDLGLCTTLTPETRIRTAKIRKTLNCGTDGFMAPELSTGMYSHPADVFSMSVTVQQTIRATGLKVKEFDSKIATLIRKGKNQNPASRPTAEEFLNVLEDYKNDLVEEETEREDTRRRSGLRARRKAKRKDDFAYTTRLRRR